jgi:ATP-dependent 26S proteasome regulatory subunit
MKKSQVKKQHLKTPLIRRCRGNAEIRIFKSNLKIYCFSGKIPKGALLVGPPGTGKHCWQKKQ